VQRLRWESYGGGYAVTTKRVLVLVKASPQPSRQYGDTVCVAGVEIDCDIPQWIRLYPVPFRYLEGELQFKKYDVISVRTRDAGADKRRESKKIDAGSIKIEEHIDGWKKRAMTIPPFEDPSMCQLIDQARVDINAQSLAAVRPAVVHGLEFSPHPGWTSEQRDRLEAYRNQGDLFREAPIGSLDPPQLVVQLSYDCLSEACPGHEQRIIDWELTALQRRYRGRPAEELEKAITRNFRSVPFGDDRDPLIFVGNQEAIQRRASFTVLGLYYPKKSDVWQSATLF
jgi:hypothetical protein